MRLPSHLSLSIKLPLVLSIVVACVAATIGVAMVERDRQRLREELSGRASLLARTVAAVAPELVLRGDTWSLYKSLRQIAHGPDDAPRKTLVTAMVLDPRGRVLAHLQPARFPVGLPAMDADSPERPRLDAELAARAPGVFEGPGFMEGVAPVQAGGQIVGLARVRLSTAEMDQQSAAAGWTVLMLSVGMAVLGIVLGAAWSLRMLRPLRRLTRSMESLGRGIFRPLPVSRRDEIGQLVASFNTMAAEIEEKRRLQSEMAANEKVLALGRIAAGVAHEVNNPLAGMLNCLSTLRAEKNDPALVERYLPLIENALRKIEALVKDLLIELRVEDAEETSDPKCLDDVRDLVAAEIDPQRIVFAWDSRLDAADAVNGTKMQQVLLNLLRNAIQAMPDGGRLTCRLDGDEAAQVFEVEDTGQGIAAADLPRIFDPFFTRRQSGTGLGLWIVLRLVRSMHGTVEVDSAPGQGTRFRIRIPREQQRVPEPA
jgi:two-component system, NtrC family, sensor kinase